MSSLIVALLAVTMPPQTTDAEYKGTPVDAPAVTATAEVVAPDWCLREWRININRALREQALAKGSAKHEATRKLITLLEQLRKTELRGSDARVMGKSLVNRLVRAHHEIVKDILEKEFEAAKAKEELTEQVDGQQAVNVDARPDGPQLGDNVVLAQAGGPFGGAAVGNGGARANIGDDEGQQLADLIEATVDPDSWDTVGGPGSIIYWNQFKVLVIRATSETHEKIGGLNDALRRVGN